MHKKNINRQKTAAVINDMSGLGRCSLTAAIPIISACNIRCCPVPTAILSNQTGYDSFYSVDFTQHMERYIDEWKKLDLHFDSILSGYLGNVKQVDIVRSFFEFYKEKNTTIIVDPVMGGNGELYPVFTEKMVGEMKKLIAMANIITPNITEACLLTGMEYKNGSWNDDDLRPIARALADMGPEKIIITGIDYYLDKGSISNYCLDVATGVGHIQSHKKFGEKRSGTGDILASLITAYAAYDIEFTESIDAATDFIMEALEQTIDKNLDPREGICFEEILAMTRYPIVR